LLQRDDEQAFQRFGHSPESSSASGTTRLCGDRTMSGWSEAIPDRMAPAWGSW
jgi:hypothetical protein